MNVICTICARKNSVGVKNKAIQILGGKPLIAHTIIQAKKSKIFNRIVVSTDSKRIQKIALNYGADSWFLRPQKLAKKLSSKESAIRHAVKESERYYNTTFAVCIDLDVTSPLRKVEDIKKAYKLFIKKKSSILFTVNEARKNPYFNMVERKGKKIDLIKKKRQIIYARQQAPKVFDMNASIYIWKRNVLMKTNNLFCCRIFFVIYKTNALKNRL